VAAHASGEAFDVVRRGGDEVARFEAAPVGVFDAGMNLDDGLDAGEARLSGIASVRRDPIDGAGSRIDARVE
jgi:hypothetical protein